TSFAFSFLAFTDPSQPVAVSPYYHTADGNASIDTFLVTTGSDTIYYNIFIEQSNHYNNRPQARLRIKSSVGNSPYKIGLCVTSDSTDFHAWNVAELTNGAGNWGAVFSSGGISGWSAGDASYGIGAPGHIECVISVAAHRAKYTIPQGSILGGEIATFSSYGSTIDNRNKPDISAPGSSVTAAVSSFTNHNPGSVSQVVQFEGRTYRFVSLSGTSMSSPFVAGVVALMLQANPALTPTEVKRIIAQTAYSDQYTQQHGSIRFGHGKIDAYSAVSKSLETTGTAAFETDKVRFHLFPNPVIDKVYISVQADSRTVITLELYDLSGRQLQKQTVYTGVNTLNMENLAAGCYVVRLCDGKNTWTRKLIK
ncbi:MAG: S8 family peptidase, partial [Bacteroidales bacterium]|nr:S8 family peptidase [Bacteroidales bacterium]